jgi:hypothetical protein
LLNFERLDVASPTVRRMTVQWPDRRFATLTPQLLDSLSADDVGSAIAQHVALQLEARREDSRDAVVRDLPLGTRAIYTTWLVDAEVNNGGFNQFFFNPYGQLAGLALAGYELLGAEDYAAVMRAAIATHEAEREMMASYYDAGTPEAFSESYQHTGLEEVDQRYYSLGDRIYDVWASFVRRRPELLLG